MKKEPKPTCPPLSGTEDYGEFINPGNSGIGIFRWWNFVVQHYGSVEHFPDASTVRKIIDMAEKEIAYHKQLYDSVLVSLGKAEAEDLFPPSDPQHISTIQVRDFLLSWLERRGMPR